MAFSLKINNKNIHFISTLFNVLETKGGMGFSMPSPDPSMNGHIFEVFGFDRDRDIIILCDKMQRTISRHGLSKGTIHTEVDPEPLLTSIADELSAKALAAIDRFHVERVFNIGDRVRFISSLCSNNAPNEALFIVEIASESEWPPANFTSQRQDVMLGYYRYDGGFDMFPADSRRLEIDK
jgi:hypothetical protein